MTADTMAERDSEAPVVDVSRPGEPRVRGRPIAVYLVIFGFAIALPALLFSGYLLYRFEEVQRVSANRVAQDTAAVIRDAIDREIDAMITTLKVLSTSAFLSSGNYEFFHGRAKAALGGTGTYVLLVGSDYQQKLNTRVPFGTALGEVSDRASVDAVLDKGAPYVSDLFFGKVANQQVFNVSIPVTLGDGSRAALIMTRNAASLQPILSELKLESAWTGTLIDRAGKVISSSGGEPIGSRASVLAAGNLDSLPFGPVTFSTSEGEKVIAARRSFDTGWWATASASAAVIQAPLRKSLGLLILAGLGLLVLTALLTLVFSRVVARPVLRLAGQARALGSGEAVPENTSPVREVNDVSQALAAAAEQRRRSEDQVRFLMRELSHRAKNQLAVVVAMARRTAENSGDMAEFDKVFSERLLALARSTDLLVNQNWEGVELVDLIEAHLMPFVPGNISRLSALGPPVELGPDAAQSIGLAFHELATNAAKYGALSAPNGVVSITWRFIGEDDRRLRLEWVESGGPEVEEPSRTGFGSIVIQRTVAQSLNGEVAHEFRPSGVYWAIDLPMEALQSERDKRNA